MAEMAQSVAQSKNGQGEGEGGSGAAALPCITGCVYHMVQTTALDGKNLLKLLPVSNPLGKIVPFVQPQVIPDNTKGNASISCHGTLKDLSIKTPEHKPSATSEKLILPKRLSQMEKMNIASAAEEDPSTLKISNIQGNFHSAVRSTLKKDATSVCSDNSNAEYVLVNTKNFPVTVKSPVLPSGHHLQIPADAEVKSVPASFLPPTIQQKILAAATSNVSGACEVTNTPTVIYVSPVNTVKMTASNPLQNICPKPVAETSSNPLVLTLPQTSDSSALDVATCDSEKKQATPMKWVVQESPKSSASCLVPVKSSNTMASKILKTLVDTKNMESNPTSILPACSSMSESQAKVTSIKDNALVMYNGKVFLLTRKESSVVSTNKCGEQASPGTEMHFRKQKSQLVSSAADSTITNQVVNLVLSKSKGIASNVKDPKSSENMKPHAQPEVKKVLTTAYTLLVSPHLQINNTSQHEAVSPSGNLAEMNVAQKSITEENTNHSIVQKILSQGPPALLSATVNDASKEEDQKIEKISSGMTVQIKHRKEQHRKQYHELRKKFGLFKEERVYLKKIPVSVSLKRSEATECSSNVQMTDSRNLLQEITIKPEPKEEEEMIIGEQREENIKRKTMISPILVNRKKRKTEVETTLNPELECTSSFSVMDNQTSPYRQIVSEQEHHTNSVQFPQRLDSDTNPSVQNEENILTHTSSCCENETFLSESSFKDIFSFSPPDLEETIKDEKIRRLKRLLSEKEAALEEIRKHMQHT
ncbi:Ligand-dependent nuclear receptor-interacting factor 1 [Varanus komodoensis]|uniref:Ligand dependent nuclear receptor interacting factor 1 n=1 Tax=Varanus komodoensis TaxID=61221 RepID=A0A8D2LLN4_VARKO|nr:ligand-dependent nuclear receptor-interacting factor 1 [Varanus komodoensis]KAF7238912.1 Ligand-dependent nuclear receptor-interacting factor 1 [Varanus komodoensis]